MSVHTRTAGRPHFRILDTCTCTPTCTYMHTSTHTHAHTNILYTPHTWIWTMNTHGRARTHTTRARALALAHLQRQGCAAAGRETNHRRRLTWGQRGRLPPPGPKTRRLPYLHPVIPVVRHQKAASSINAHIPAASAGAWVRVRACVRHACARRVATSYVGYREKSPAGAADRSRPPHQLCSCHAFYRTAAATSSPLLADANSPPARLLARLSVCLFIRVFLLCICGRVYIPTRTHG